MIASALNQEPLKVLDLFSGIGGFSLGLERAGMETIAFCEFDIHAQKVLKKHWPDVALASDIRNLEYIKEGDEPDDWLLVDRSLNSEIYRGSVDVVCGGFPCQDLSSAGDQAGFDGERSSLYREMLRIISDCMPRYAIFENVAGLVTGDSGRWFAKFLYDLAAIGFDAEWHCIEAAYIGAPHKRDRVWIIAYPSIKNDGVSDKEASQAQAAKFGSCFGAAEMAPNANGKRLEGSGKESLSREFNLSEQLKRSLAYVQRGFDLSEPPLCGANDGPSGRTHRLKQLGNAVVPQIPEAIGRAIMAVEAEKQNVKCA